jgi:O-antigen/teichoic acid export membrane protein
MSEAVKIRKNSFFSFVSISSRLLANVVLFLALARFYGPTLFGKFAFAHSLSLIFILFADFGIDVLFINEIARERENAIRFFQQFFTLKIFLVGSALLLMNVFIFFTNSDPQGKILILIFSIYTVLTALSNFLYSLFKGFEKLEFEMKASLFTNLILLIIAIVLLSLKSDIIIIAIAFVGARFLGFLLALRYSFVVLPGIKYKLTFVGLSSLKNKVLIFGIHLIFNYLLFQMDTILLAVLKNDYYVGIYQAAFKLILIPLLVPEILINVLTPVLARLNSENKQQWQVVGNAMSKILYIVIIPISVVLFVYAEQIIKIIYGSNNYQAAIPVLRIFAIVLFLRFNFEAFALMLTTSNKQKVRMIIVIIAAILNFILNYFAIPKYGVLGASYVALITNFVVALLYWLTTLPFFYQWFFQIKIGSVFVLTVIMVFLLYQFRQITMFLMIPLILCVFLFVGYFYFLNEEEKKIIIPDKIRILGLK